MSEEDIADIAHPFQLSAPERLVFVLLALKNCRTICGAQCE